MSEIDDFLKKIGMREEPNHWEKVIQPSSSYLIVGDVGTGKSALAYYLLETFSRRYNLLPAVVGFPRAKRALLPDDFIILDNAGDCTKHENIIVFIDEADLQLPIEDTKARKYVINFLSLPRHRNQIFLLAFHFPRLVMGRYLPFFSAFLLKRPPYLIEFAGKRQGDALTKMMEKAEERFSELPNDDVVKNAYIVAPRIRWQGMLQNPLCSFWEKELDKDGNSVLSRIWAGTEIESELKLGMSQNPSPQRIRKVAYGEAAVPPTEFRVVPVTSEGVIIGFEVYDPTGSTIRQREKIADLLHEQFPGVSREAVENAQIGYEEYVAYIVLGNDRKR